MEITNYTFAAQLLLDVHATVNRWQWLTVSWQRNLIEYENANNILVDIRLAKTTRQYWAASGYSFSLFINLYT